MPPNNSARRSPLAVISGVVERWMPDAFIIAILLTTLTFILCIGVAGYSPHDTVVAWGDGFWRLLTFTNQIVLTLLFGYAMAHTPPMIKALNWCASRIRSPGQAYLMVGYIALFASAFSWALGLVGGAIMARLASAVCADRGIKVHYPLMVTLGYCGIGIWHQGLSGSIGLTLATPGHFLEDLTGVIPASQTVFTSWNLATLAVAILLLPLVLRRAAPSDEALTPFPQQAIAHELGRDTESAAEERELLPAEKLEKSRIIGAIAVVGGLYYIVNHFVFRGNGLDLNTLNFCFLILGLAFAGNPAAYLRYIYDAARVCSPFLLQYPFYAGIAGMMADSGLAQMIVNGFVSLATPQNLPLYTFFSGGVLNIFVPSGGGQWAIQGPIAMGAAVDLGADLRKVAMAVAMGDQWTNLVQPLNALPALAIAGLHIRDIMSYCLVALLLTGTIFCTALLIIQ